MAREPARPYYVVYRREADGSGVSLAGQHPSVVYARGVDGAIKAWNRRFHEGEHDVEEGERYEVTPMGETQYVTVTGVKVTTKLTVETDE